MTEPLQQIVDVLASAARDYASMGWSTTQIDAALALARSMKQGDGWQPTDDQLAAMWDRFVEARRARLGIESIKNLIGGAGAMRMEFIAANAGSIGERA